MLARTSDAWRKVLQHPITHEGLAITWNRILSSGLRFFLVRWAFRAELERAGCTLSTSTVGQLLLTAAQAVVCGCDTNLVGGFVDAVAMRYWTSPSLAWLRIPTIAELEADLIDPATPASSTNAAGGSTRRQRSQSPTQRNVGGAAADQPRAAAEQANDETMVATAGSINLGPADSMAGGGGVAGSHLPAAPSKWAQRVRWLRIRASLGIHAVVTASVVVGIRRQVTITFRSLAWGALGNLVLAVEPPSGLPSRSAMEQRVNALTGVVDGFVLLYDMRQCMRNDAQLFRGRSWSPNVFQTAGIPAVAQGVSTLLALLLVNGGVGANVIPTLRRRVLRPMYRRWPKLRGPSRHVETALAAAGPRLAYGIVAAPWAMLKLRVFAAAYLGTPYASLGAAVYQMVVAEGVGRTLAAMVAFAGVQICLGKLNELDVPSLIRRFALWVKVRSFPAPAVQYAAPPEAAAADADQHEAGDDAPAAAA